jgi:DNA adenine methylase
MKRTKRNLRKKESIVNHTVNLLPVLKWDLHRKLLADLIKIVTNKFAFLHFVTYICDMLSYIGGKSKIGKWIESFYLKDMETYVETFGGMFWCYFNMNLSQYPNLKRIVYNDFNPLNYNLFKCVQNPNELLRAINYVPVQQKGVYPTPIEHGQRFREFQTELFSTGFTINYPDYEVAAKYVYILTQVFSGSKPEKSSFIDLKGEYKSKYLTFRDKLLKPDWIEHFTRITHVENLDFQEVIQKYDSPSTYIYLDPPYWKTENYYSNHDFDRQDHERLSEILNQVQSKFSLSYYDFDLLHKWYPETSFRWERKKFVKAAAAKKGTKQNLGEELLIMNY